MFRHLKQCADLGILDFLGTILDGNTALVKIEAILKKAVDVYDNCCVAGLWIKLDKSTQGALAAGVNSCWNCGAQGHSAMDCTKPCDTATFEKNRKAFYDQTGRPAPPSHGVHTQHGKDSGQNKSSAEYQQKVWAEAGIRMFNGQLMVKYKTCGFNTTHSNCYHNSYKKNTSTF